MITGPSEIFLLHPPNMFSPPPLSRSLSLWLPYLMCCLSLSEALALLSPFTGNLMKQVFRHFKCRGLALKGYETLALFNSSGTRVLSQPPDNVQYNLKAFPQRTQIPLLPLDSTKFPIAGICGAP